MASETKERDSLAIAVGASKAALDIALGDGDAITSANSLPKDEGGLEADVLAGLRFAADRVAGADALGQPGQEGHGTGTSPGFRLLTEEEAKADDAAYRKRFS